MSYGPGARVLEYLARRQGGTLGRELALQQWDLVREQLLKRGLDETVEEALESPRGGLDTLPRDDVQDAWGHVSVGRTWPTYGEGDAVYAKFIEAFGTYLKGLGATKLPADFDPRAA